MYESARPPLCFADTLILMRGTRVIKFREGQYNKSFLLTFDDNSEVVAKIPNPNAGPRFFTTASEVATMEFVSYTRRLKTDGMAKVRRHVRFSVYRFRKSLAGVAIPQTLWEVNTSSWKRRKGLPSGMPGISFLIRSSTL